MAIVHCADLPFDRLRANGNTNNPFVLSGLREALVEARNDTASRFAGWL